MVDGLEPAVMVGGFLGRMCIPFGVFGRGGGVYFCGDGGEG